MLITWEAKDIICGRRVRSLACNEMWMIGYDASKRQGVVHALTLISLNDGMVIYKDSLEHEMAAHLNRGEMYPVELLDDKGCLKMDSTRR